jgi:hypothetical protein
MHPLGFLVVLAAIAAAPSLPDDACKVPASGKPAKAASTTVAAKHQSPFACDRMALTPSERKRHFEELGPALLVLKSGVHELPDGYEFRFPSDRKTFAMVAEWVDQERLCCPFFDLSMRFEPEGGPIWLRVTGRPGTKEFMRVEGAAWIKK